jgi:hypothetical protein
VVSMIFTAQSLPWSISFWLANAPSTRSTIVYEELRSPEMDAAWMGVALAHVSAVLRGANGRRPNTPYLSQ